MNQFKIFCFIILFSLTSLTEAVWYAKRGCKDTCGQVRIPYPFGIGANCSINKWYVVECNSSIPYLSAFNNMQVLNVSMEQQTIDVNVSMISNWQNPIMSSTHILGADHGRSPFLFSKLHNILVLKGCGIIVIVDDESVVSGCSSTCRNDTVSDINNCFGTGCCQTTIPYHLDSFTLNLTCSERRGREEACGSAFLVNKDFVGEKISHQYIHGNDASVPISLLWTLTDHDYRELKGCPVSNKNFTFGAKNGTLVRSHKCECRVEWEGNPYIDGDCEVPEECQKCERSGGRCAYDTTYNEELFVRWSIRCISGTISDTNSGIGSSKISIGVILGVSISIGLLFLVAISHALHKVIKKTKAKRRKETFFKRNGGLLLGQQTETAIGLVDHKTILFTSKELEKATDHFNDNRILGRGGQGTVYKGMLADGRIVAVKKSKVVDESQLEQFINEIVILSQVNHRNVVKLLGCCLETDVPLLVFEFVSNGTLYDLVHDDTSKFPISFKMRLQIATEVAEAVSYLHSETSIPIYHRDIKTTNILLDEKYRAKVSDFGTSRFVSIDQTHLTTLVKGTFGYLDPEYFQSSQFTEKSDVYSFGVVLLELLTREKPISLTRFGENRSLATHFMLAMEEGRVMSIFDAMVVKDGSRDELLAMANLAMRCLNFNGKFRPTMKEVAIELEGMRMSLGISTIETDFGHVNYSKDQLMLTYGEPTSTTISFIEESFETNLFS